MNESRIPVAAEGYPFIGVAALVTLVLAILGCKLLALLALALTTFILYFFRDPERTVPDDDDVVVSPADGKVILIEKLFDDQFVKEHVYKISIFMNLFNVHVNRSPLPGTVTQVRHVPGSFLAANTEQAALENEHCALTLVTADRQKLAVVQVAGLIARRIVCWAIKGDLLARGQRFGLIRFGSRVDLYLPLQLQLEVRPGQKVRAGETVLGYLSQR